MGVIGDNDSGPGHGYLTGAGTFEADGVLVRDLPNSGLQWVSCRTEFSSFAEADGDPRRLTSGTAVIIGVGVWEYVTSGEHLVTSGGAKVRVLEDKDGRRNARAFGADDYRVVADSGDALQTAFAVGGTIVIDRKMRSNRPLVVDATTTRLEFAPFQGAMIEVGTSFPSGGQLITVKNMDRTSGGTVREKPYLTGAEKFFSSANLMLSGRGRATPAHGLVLDGRVDDLSMLNTAIHDFRGCGFMAGNYRAETQQEQFRESGMWGVHVKNCGDVTNDYASVELGVNNYQFPRPVGAINNIDLYHFKVVYPRGVGIRVRNLGAGRVKSSRHIRFVGLFVHGNRSLRGSDPNGEPWHSGKPLIQIGHEGATRHQTCAVSADGYSIVEQEIGVAAVEVWDGSQIFFNNGYAAANTRRPGFRFTKAGSCAVTNFCTEHSRGDGKHALANLFEVISFKDQASLTLANISGPPTPFGSPSYVGNISYLDDAGEHLVNFCKETDAEASDILDDQLLTVPSTKTLNINEIRLIPTDDLAASDTDYATLVVESKLNGTHLIASITTQPSGLGGSGDWKKLTPISVPVSAVGRLNTGQALTFRILKSGAGTALPRFFLQCRLSSNISVN